MRTKFNEASYSGRNNNWGSVLVALVRLSGSALRYRPFSPTADSVILCLCPAGSSITARPLQRRGGQRRRKSHDWLRESTNGRTLPFISCPASGGGTSGENDGEVSRASVPGRASTFQPLPHRTRHADLRRGGAPVRFVTRRTFPDEAEIQRARRATPPEERRFHPPERAARTLRNSKPVIGSFDQGIPLIFFFLLSNIPPKGVCTVGGRRNRSSSRQRGNMDL